MTFRRPQHLELRRRLRFLILPRSMGGVTKWLCRGHWVQVFIDRKHWGRWRDYYWLTPGGDVQRAARGYEYSHLGVKPIPFIDEFRQAKTLRPKS